MILINRINNVIVIECVLNVIVYKIAAKIFVINVIVMSVYTQN